jgi:3-hydroxyacyl-CoA dehydrogenase
MIVAHSAKLGRARRVLEPCEIVDRALLSMANEGFKIVEEGIAQRESDVDIVYIYGYGYPRRQGGPLYWARHGREGGLAKMVEDLRKYAASQYYELLEKPVLPDNLVQVLCWVLGEYGYLPEEWL